MLVALGREFVEARIAERVRVGEVDHAMLVTVFEHVVEDRAPPGLGGIALVARAVLEGVGLVGLDVVPAEAAALEDRMQRVDDDEAVGQIDAFGAAALAEAPEQVVFRQASEALADQPVHQAHAGNDVHGPIMPRNGRDESVGLQCPEST